MKIKVAIIIPGGIGAGYFTQGIPVLEDFISRMSEYCDVTVYSMIRVDARYLPQQFKIRSVKAMHRDATSKKVILTSLLLIEDHLRKRYDLIHGIWGYPSGLTAVILGKVLRIPSLVSLQGGETANVPEIGYGLMQHTFMRSLMLWICKHANLITTLTRFQRSQLETSGYRGKEVEVIPYGADPEKFCFFQKALVAPFQLIHIGNLTAVKDQKTLLRCFAIIAAETDSCLKIIGDGEEVDDLKKITDNLGITDKVEFLGALPHLEIQQHFCKSHILLHTSLYEAQAVVAAEAAASGTVVCGTKTGILADWGEDNCIAVPVGDYEILGRKVIDLLHQQDQYFYLQKNAYEWSKQNTAANTAEKFRKLYDKLLVKKD